MSRPGTEAKDDSQGRPSPLVIGIAIVVLVLLLILIWKITLGKPKPEPATGASAAITAPTIRAEAQLAKTLNEPKMGDVVWWEARYRDGKPIAIFETVLERKKENGVWIARGKFVHSENGGRVELTPNGYLCHLLNDRHDDVAVETIYQFESGSVKAERPISVDVVDENVYWTFKRLEKEHPLKE